MRKTTLYFAVIKLYACSFEIYRVCSDKGENFKNMSVDHTARQLGNSDTKT